MLSYVKTILSKNKYTRALITSETFQQATRYFVVAWFCMVFDFSMLYAFKEFLHINYLIAAIMSFSISAVVNYLLCVHWVFDVRLVKKQYNELMFYIILSGIGLGLSTFLIWLFTEVAGLYFMLSKLFASGITFFCNFASRKYLLHTKK